MLLTKKERKKERKKSSENNTPLPVPTGGGVIITTPGTEMERENAKDWRHADLQSSCVRVYAAL